MRKLYMRSAKQAAMFHAGLRGDGSANQNQHLMQNDPQGIWRQNADLRDRVVRHSRGVIHTRQAPVAHARQSGSEAKLGDIIVTVMRRLDALDLKISRLSAEFDARTREHLSAMDRMCAEMHAMFSSVRDAPYNDRNVQPRCRNASVTTTVLGHLSVIDDEEWSDAVPTDGEGYNYDECFSNRASPTPSERADCDARIAAGQNVEVIAASDVESASENTTDSQAVESEVAVADRVAAEVAEEVVAIAAEKLFAMQGKDSGAQTALETQEADAALEASEVVREVSGVVVDTVVPDGGDQKAGSPAGVVTLDISRGFGNPTDV